MKQKFDQKMNRGEGDEQGAEEAGHSRKRQSATQSAEQHDEREVAAGGGARPAEAPDRRISAAAMHA